MKRKLISISTSCYNEEKNLWEFYGRTSSVMDQFQQYDFELIISENGSTDQSKDVLRAIAEKDSRVKVIINSRNFGPSRSSYNSIRHAKGDCVISIVTDLQDPPELLIEFIKRWESGSKVVIGVKNNSKENKIMFLVRKLYYSIMRSVSETEMVTNFTGFGLYDKSIAQYIFADDWPVPFLRGTLGEFCSNWDTVYYIQERRKHGKSSYNFFRYFDTAMRGITSYSKAPLRLATLIGFFLSGFSLFVALFYLILKIVFWDSMQAGIAPLVIGLFFFASVQILLVGLVGEYVLQILEYVRKKPLVIEDECIGFSNPEKDINSQQGTSDTC